MEESDSSSFSGIFSVKFCLKMGKEREGMLFRGGGEREKGEGEGGKEETLNDTNMERGIFMTFVTIS